MNNPGGPVVLGNMYRASIPLLSLLISLSTAAQPLGHVWSERVGGAADGEKLWRLAVDGEGNVYATGYFRGTFSDQGQLLTSIGGTDLILLKYDPSGNLVWSRSGGGLLDDGAFGIECDKDGNVYVTGIFAGVAAFGTELVSAQDVDGTALVQHFIARYSPDGELVWLRTPTSNGAPGSYSFSWGHGIKLDRSGDLVVVGSYNATTPTNDDATFSTMSMDGFRFRTCAYGSVDYIFAQKIDTLGNTEWVHTIGGMNGCGVLLSLNFDTQNNAWIGGNYYYTDLVSGPVDLELTGGQYPLCGLVYQLSPEGEALSGFGLSSTEQVNVEDLIVANNGEIFLAGWYRGGFQGAAPAQGYDGFFMRTSPSGTPLWINRLVGPGDDYFSGIANSPSPNTMAGAAYYFFEADLAGTTLDQYPGITSALILMDTTGVVQEVLQPEVLVGSCLIADVQSDELGNYFISGDLSGQVRFTNDTISCTSQDMYISKISRQVTTAVDRTAPVRSITLFPNPASGRVTIALNTPPAPGTTYALVDALGRMVSSGTIQQDRTDLPLDGARAGYYQVRIEAEGDVRVFPLIVEP